MINGELHNIINALWMKNKSEVNDEEYTQEEIKNELNY